MEPLVQLIWWIGLLVAVLLTLAILKAVTLTLNALADVQLLAETTRDAARGVAANVAVEDALRELHGGARALTDGAGALSAGAAALDSRMGLVFPAPSGEGRED